MKHIVKIVAVSLSITILLTACEAEDRIRDSRESKKIENRREGFYKAAEKRAAEETRPESASKSVEIMPVSAECAWTLKSQKGNSYHPMQMFDGDNATCWSANLNEIIADCDVRWGPTIDFGRKVYLDEVRIVNGYAKNRNSWSNNARVAGLVIFDADKGFDPEEYWGMEDNSAAPLFEVELADNSRLQNFKPLPGASKKKVRRVGLGFSGIYQGNKFEDLCISELKFIGRPAD